MIRLIEKVLNVIEYIGLLRYKMSGGMKLSEWSRYFELRKTLGIEEER